MTTRSDKGRLPDFIGIGVPKAASNWIYQTLIAHPEVVGRRKELHFFSEPRAYSKGIEHYAALFSACPVDRLAGEFTATYMYGAETAVRIRRWLPQVKIIASLRDPVARAFSHYKYSIQMQARLSAYSTFEEAIEKDHELLEHGMYATPLETYYDLFPAEHILVLMYDDIVTKPADVVRKLYEFVGVSDPSFVPEQGSRRINRTGDFDVAERLPWMNRTLYSLRHRVQHGSALERWAVGSGAAALARRVIKANRVPVAPGTAPAPARPAPVLHPETSTRLYARYREDGERLRQLLGRDVPWLS